MRPASPQCAPAGGRRCPPESRIDSGGRNHVCVCVENVCACICVGGGQVGVYVRRNQESMGCGCVREGEVSGRPPTRLPHPIDSPTSPNRFRRTGVPMLTCPLPLEERARAQVSWIRRRIGDILYLTSFFPSVRPSVRPSIHPSIHPNVPPSVRPPC